MPVEATASATRETSSLPTLRTGEESVQEQLDKHKAELAEAAEQWAKTKEELKKATEKQQSLDITVKQLQAKEEERSW